jgi:3',5'-cyclic AMP phosphodiesterase CpdA/CheY-like chemotaxis protein
MKRKVSILWAEDKASKFRTFAKTLDNYLSDHNMEAVYVHAVDGNELYRYLAGAVFDVLVADIAMPHWSGIDAVKDLSQRYPGLPMIVVSAYTKERHFLFELESLVREGRLESFHSAMSREEWCGAVVRALSYRAPTILHLSDIHFGRFHGIPEGLSIERLMMPILGKIGESSPIDLVIVSGDLCSIANEKEFEAAHKFLNSLLSKLKLSADRLIVVPGNHDIDRGERAERSFVPFVRFLAEMYRDCPESTARRFPSLFDGGSRIWRTNSCQADEVVSISVFDEFRTIVVGLNSVVAHENAWDEARISAAQLLRVTDLLGNLSERQSRYDRIAVFHHHLIESPTFRRDGDPGRLIKNQGFVLNHLIANSFKLVLHGHTHYCMGYEYRPFVVDNETLSGVPIYVFGTGTLSGSEREPAQSFFHFSILKLKASSGLGVDTADVQAYRLMDSSFEWRALPQIRVDWPRS